MKAKISRLQRFSVDDGPGIRTTVFFMGCNLRCKWCHNPECIGLKEAEDSPLSASIEMTVEELLEKVLRDFSFYAASGGGVTLSGGEPLLRPEFTAAFTAECAKRGLHTAIDTAGLVPFDAIEEAAKNARLLLYDIKAVSPEIHKSAAGCDNSLILENIEKINALRLPARIRIPVIPGINTGEEMKKIAQFVGKLDNIEQVELLPYHRYGVNKYKLLGIEYKLASLREPDKETLELQYSYFRGLRQKVTLETN